MATASFAQLLQHHRAAAGLTQEELAERARLSARAISDLERGVKQRPYAYTVQRLVQALGLDAPEAAGFKRAARRLGERVCGAAPLPIVPTPFIGRQREVSVVSALLRRADVRLLTLTGPGGVGKTRLAVQVAAAVAETFPDGVAFVALVSLADPALVPTALATALGLPEARGQPVLATLTRHLQPQRLLLVLDNFEHLRPAADVVAHLLGACPRLTVLVTSRALLQLAAEHTYAVPSLAMPPGDHQPALATLARYDAVRLFLQRAAAVQPGFTLTPENAGAIVAICQQVDGLPLALELVAARLRLFPPPALLARLEHRLPLLAGGPRDLPIRHQTMRQTVDWSYRLLTADEQRLFARLAVFAGGCTFAAIEAVCQADAALDALAGTTALVAQCLLRSEGDAEPRFEMLETIREYALERLEARGEAEEVRRRHAAYYLALAQQAGPLHGVVVEAAWLDRMEREHDNLRAALGWAHDRGEGDLEAELVLALGLFWQLRGYHREARERIEGLLAVHGRHGPALPPDLRADLRAGALCALGAMMPWQGDHEQAVPLLEESLALYRALGESRGTAECLHILSQIALDQGAYERARALGQELLALAHDKGDILWRASALLDLGHVAYAQGDGAQMERWCGESLTLCRAVGNPPCEGWALNALGRAAWLQQDVLRATALFAASLAAFRELGFPAGVAEVLSNVGRLARAQGHLEQAQAAFRESLALARTASPLATVLGALEGLAGVAGAQQQAEQATRLLSATQVLRESKQMSRWPLQQALYERDAAATRAALRADAFAAAWAAGQALPLEQAIAEALAGRAAAHDAPLRHPPTRPQAVPQADAPARHRLARADRQAWVVERLRTVGALSPGAYAAALGVSTDTALRDLQQLVDRGVVQAGGTTRTRRYVLAGDTVTVGSAIHRSVR